MIEPVAGRKCQWKGCKNDAQGYHCKSCDAVVCKEHQKPSGYGNYGNLKQPITILTNTKWRPIK